MKTRSMKVIKITLMNKPSNRFIYTSIKTDDVLQ